MFEFGELRCRVPAFLEVEVHAVVDRIDHDVLPPPSGEKDEGEVPVPFPYCL